MLVVVTSMCFSSWDVIPFPFYSMKNPAALQGSWNWLLTVEQIPAPSAPAQEPPYPFASLPFFNLISDYHAPLVESNLQTCKMFVCMVNIHLFPGLNHCSCCNHFFWNPTWKIHFKNMSLKVSIVPAMWQACQALLGSTEVLRAPTSL